MSDEPLNQDDPEATTAGDAGGEAGAESEPEPEPEPHPLLAALQGAFDDAEHEGDDELGSPIVRVPAGSLTAAMTFLRDDESVNYLSSVTAIDWPEREPRFDLVYHVYSIARNLRMTVKCGCADGDGVPSMVDIWPSADWLERETYDLYGIEFLGHPDLRRIFMPEDWEGFPLRKDYPLEGPNLELLTRQQAAFRGGRFDRIRGEYEMNEQERQMAAPGIVGPLWTPKPEEPEDSDSDQPEHD